MRYHALACDYDGTLARGGVVAETTRSALERLRGSGRRLVLVTGRMLDDLLAIFPEATRFDRIVAENGGVLHRPDTRETRALGSAPDARLVAALREKGVTPLAVGEVMIATWEPWEGSVLEAIRERGLELQVTFNKGAVMILPAGINKQSGLAAALAELGISLRNTVGIGDAENDHAFLSACECSVAVANALPTVKEHADWITRRDHGAGVEELIDRLLESDLRELEPRLLRHQVPLGRAADGRALALPGHGANVLIAGASGSGKSTFATGLLERLRDRGAQLLVIDPEGDYQEIAGLTAVGSRERPPDTEELLGFLEPPAQNAAVNLLGLPVESRPGFFARLWPRIQELRRKSGRPHWVLVDEAHHLVPRERDPAWLGGADDEGNVLWVTVHPDHLARSVAQACGYVVAIGRSPREVLAGVAAARGVRAPEIPLAPLERGEAILWLPDDAEPPLRFRSLPTRAERRRHVRKYAQGELAEEQSFYFRGPHGKLKLRASNLMVFLQLADGVDDDTWLHHLRRGEYSRWFRDSIKDEELADEATVAERRGADPASSRALIRAAIESRYTLPV